MNADGSGRNSVEDSGSKREFARMDAVAGVQRGQSKNGTGFVAAFVGRAKLPRYREVAADRRPILLNSAIRLLSKRAP